jgi:hypothetical protein
MPRRRYGKPIDLRQLRAVLSQAILDTKQLTDVPEPSQELVLKVAHALAQLTGPYRQLLEASDLEQRLTALEQRISAETNSHGTVP